MIDPAYDVWVWATAMVFLLLMGARAYVVEAGQARLGRAPATARMLTAVIVVVVVVLTVLLAVQGGGLLLSSVLHHTDPSHIPNVVLDPTQPAANQAPDGAQPAGPN